MKSREASRAGEGRGGVDKRRLHIKVNIDTLFHAATSFLAVSYVRPPSACRYQDTVSCGAIDLPIIVCVKTGNALGTLSIPATGDWLLVPTVSPRFSTRGQNLEKLWRVAQDRGADSVLVSG